MASKTVKPWEKDTNTMCETRNKSSDTDEVLLLHCSFCRFAYHNSAECLGDQSRVLPKNLAESDLEWACPKCWPEAAKSKSKKDRRVVPKVKPSKKKKTN